MEFRIKMANPKSSESLQAFLDKNPFDGLKIDDNSVLNKLDGRQPCPKCGKSRKLFCYTCYVPIANIQGRIPQLNLPIKIDIIKHKQEIDGKSTAVHAAILAPHDVSIYTYPNIPDYSKEIAVLVYPSQNSRTIGELVQNTYESLLKPSLDASGPKGFNPGTLKKISSTSIPIDKPAPIPITKAVFIDSTWNQSKGIYKDERIKRIPCVVIQTRISQFWRHQKSSPRWYLATIEAIHQFLIELHVHSNGLHPNYRGIHNCFTENAIDQLDSLILCDKEAYNGQYDNLLYFFQHMYQLIHSFYDHDNLYAYKRRLQ